MPNNKKRPADRVEPLLQFLAQNAVPEVHLKTFTKKSWLGRAARQILHRNCPENRRCLFDLLRGEGVMERYREKLKLSAVHPVVNNVVIGESQSAVMEEPLDVELVTRCTSPDNTPPPYNIRCASTAEVVLHGHVEDFVEIHKPPQDKPVVVGRRKVLEGVSCGTCVLEFGPRAAAFKCSLCNVWYHAKHNCCVFTKDDFKKKKTGEQSSWKCQNCIGKAQPLV